MNTQQEMADNIKLLEAAKKDFQDSFIVKITRRNAPGDPFPGQWAAFNRATMSQIINRELWLTRIIPEDCGGVFELTVIPTAQPDRIIFMSGFPVVKEGGTKNLPPNLAAFHANDWNGPTDLLFPREQAKPAAAAISVSAPQSTVMPTSIPSSQDARNAMGRSDTDAAKQLLDAASQLEKQRLALAEERHKFELETVQKKSDGAINELRSQIARFESLLAQPRTETKQISLIEQIPTLLAALTPLIGMFMKSNEERQAFMVAMFDKNAEKQAAALDKLVEAVKAKPLGDESGSKMMRDMMEAMGQAMKMNFQVAHQARELAAAGQGEPPSPVVEAFGRAADAIEKVANGYFNMMQKRPVFVAPGQQNGTMMQQQQQATVQNGAAGALPAAPQNEQPTIEAQVQPPQNPNAPAPIESNIVPAPANVVAFPPVEKPLSKSLIDIKAMILAYEDPTKVVATIFERWQSDKAFEAEIAAADGDPTELFMKHIGEAWLQADEKNVEYAQKVGEVLVAEATKRGMVAADPANGAENAPQPTN